MIDVEQSEVYLLRKRHPDGRVKTAWTEAALCRAMFGDELAREKVDSIFIFHCPREQGVKVDVMKTEDWFTIRTEHDVCSEISELGMWDDKMATSNINAGTGDLNIQHQTVTASKKIVEGFIDHSYFFRERSDYRKVCRLLARLQARINALP